MNLAGLNTNISISEVSEKTNFTSCPFVLICLSFAAGICLESLLSCDFWFWLIISISCLVIAAVLFFIRSPKVSFVIIVACFCVGAFHLTVQNSTLDSNRLRSLYDRGIFRSGDPIEIFATLIRKERAVGGVFLYLSAESAIYKGEKQEVSGIVRLFVPINNQQMENDYNELGIDYGSGVAVYCELRREDRFRNDGVISGKTILDRKGIDAIGYLKSPLLIERRNDLDNWSPFFSVLRIREKLIDEILTLFSVRTAGVLIASFLGNPYFLDRSISESFLEGGTFHLLVISGAQVAFIAGIVILTLGKFIENPLIKFLLAACLVWIYAFSVGFYEKPVIRAALMFTIFAFGRINFRPARLQPIGGQPTMLNLLAASAFILLLIDPNDLFDPSFQLTILSVLAIVATASPIITNLRSIGNWRPSSDTPMPPVCNESLRVFCECLYWSEQKWKYEVSQNVWSCKLFKSGLAHTLEKHGLQRILAFLFEALILTISIQVWLLPLMILYFHRVSFSAVLLNLWVGLVMTLESVIALFSLISHQLSPYLSLIFISVTEILNEMILNATHLLTSTDISTFRPPHYSGVLKSLYLIYFLPVAYISYSIFNWNPYKKSARKNLSVLAVVLFLSISLVLLFHPFSHDAADGRLYVEFLDVGQGDAIFLKMPTGETMMIDGGGSLTKRKFYIDEDDTEIFEPETMRIGESVVSPFLWAKGYDTVDLIMVTHSDSDHIEGLIDVAKNFNVRTAILSKKVVMNDNLRQLYEILRRQETDIIFVSSGDQLAIGEVRMQILNPSLDSSDSENNDSIVLRVCHKKICFLLTGDIEKEVEARLVASSSQLRADVVKVPHHGSSTSSTQEFVRSTGARFAVISVGKDSPFGHPKKEVIERWRNSGAEVLMTGELGTIKFVSDGDNIRFSTFSQEEKALTNLRY